MSDVGEAAAGLEISSLCVDYLGPDGGRAVNDVSYTVASGESVGVVGESGCGKSTAVRAAINLLPSNGRISSGSVRWNGLDLVTATDEAIRSVRWREIALIPQASMNALNPVQRVTAQIDEVLRVRGGLDKATSGARIEQLALLVGIDAERLRGYPHQLSGGMRQRAVIAMALALSPSLLLADEATTGLDPVVQKRILNRLDELQQAQGFSVVYVSHDLALMRDRCMRILVMYAGEIVESASSQAIFDAPDHPYAMALRSAVPTMRDTERRLVSIPGSPPALADSISGCRFAPRCPFATDKCRTEKPPLVTTRTGAARCHYVSRSAEFRERFAAGDVWAETA